MEMIKIKDYIQIYPHVVKKETCEKIIHQPDLTFEQATVRDGALKISSRNCYTKRLDPQFDQEIFEVVADLIERYRKTFKYFSTGLTIEDSGYDHLLYKGSQKGEYKTHVDHYDLSPRVLSCSFILNDNFDGGDFSFFDGQYIVKKEAGSAIMFPSNFCFPHAVTPVTKGDRHALITWIH